MVADHHAKGEKRAERLTFCSGDVGGTMPQLIHKIAMKTRYAGRGRYCPVCEHESRHFAEHRGKPERRCPRCGSLERHRAMWPWLQTRLAAGQRVLHIAPEQGIQARLRAMP